jgi:TonB family protein
MRTLETWLLNYSVNALWQVPIVFAAAWIAAGSSRRAGPAFQHSLWTSALIAEVILPACSARPDQAFQTLLRWLASFRQSSIAQDAHVTVTMGPAHAAAGFHMPPTLLAAVAFLYLGALAYFAIRLCIGLYQTASLRGRAEPLALSGYAGQSYHRFAQIFGVRDATLATSAEIAGPITLGIRRPVLLLPSALDTHLLGEDLDAVLAHEFAHMRRRDFAKNLAYEVLSLPIAFHPLLWITRSRMAETRELVCDAMAAEVVAGRQRYARSLLRLATKFSEQAHAPTPHAIGIFDAHPFKNFERRVMNLTHNSLELRGAARVATAALRLLLIGGACTSALAFRMHVAASPSPTTTPAQTPQPEKTVRIGAGVIAGNRLTFVEPVYPPDAKAAKLSGTVVLHALIGKDGLIKELTVVSGPDEFRESALNAVKQWTYKPYLLNGDPTEVDTTITVNYALNDQ